MIELSKEHPHEYPKGTPPLTKDEVEALVGRVPEWRANEGKLQRSFEFVDFNASFGFVTRVALLAEAEGHHPDIFVSWSKVDLTFWTHTADGLTRNDFIMAAKVDVILG